MNNTKENIQTHIICDNNVFKPIDLHILAELIDNLPNDDSILKFIEFLEHLNDQIVKEKVVGPFEDLSEPNLFFNDLKYIRIEFLELKKEYKKFIELIMCGLYKRECLISIERQGVMLSALTPKINNLCS
ncbi:12861_t:CDS:2 [Gigaspora margarita]|uniref:12861_t:CDS:1 n=1 Tax=Gigaspora margarita TaxID=4874 RepID=A0ABN7UEA5_GIGMA|nr:12861_t:CDS:2 [Gigaspora margarita]